MSETVTAQQGQGDVVNLNIQDWLRKQVAHLRGIDSGSGDADWLTKAAEELDRLYDENHAIKLEVMGGEDVPGSASAVTVEDVCAEVARLRTLLSSSRGEQGSRGWRTIDESTPRNERIRVWAWDKERIAHWYSDRYAKRPRPFWSIDGLSTTDSRAHQPEFWMPCADAPGSVPTSLAGQVPDDLLSAVDTFIRCTENGYFGKRGLKTSPIFLAMKTARERCPAGARGNHPELLSNREPAPLASPQPTAGGDADAK